MLAKEMKIRNLKKQREYIRKGLENVATLQDDGDCSYVYVGHIFPEVVSYFESEGYRITQVESDMLLTMTRGLPINLFTIGDIKLSEEEVKQAEEYEWEKDGDEKSAFEEDDPFFANINPNGIFS